MSLLLLLLLQTSQHIAVAQLPRFDHCWIAIPHGTQTRVIEPHCNCQLRMQQTLRVVQPMKKWSPNGISTNMEIPLGGHFLTGCIVHHHHHLTLLICALPSIQHVRKMPTKAYTPLSLIGCGSCVRACVRTYMTWFGWPWPRKRPAPPLHDMIHDMVRVALAAKAAGATHT